MFFSMIVPTYNPRKWLPTLLNSVRNSFCYKEIEIILSDDCSTEPFEDLLDDYKDMNIRVIYNDKHYGFPRWGRQHGLEEATGEWICFSDQDDLWLDNAFDQIYKVIKRDNLKYYIVSNFYMRPEKPDADGKQEDTPMVQTLNWTHGKFYERKFLVENDIHYDETRYCEDINFSSQVDCHLREIEGTLTFVDIFTYVWIQRNDSLSRANSYKEYFFHSFPEYITSTVGVYIRAYEQKGHKDEELDEFYTQRILQTFSYFFYYFQGMINQVNGCPPIPNKYYHIIAHWWKRYAACKQLTTDEMFQELYYKYFELFNNTRATAYSQIRFFEYESFESWIRTKIIPVQDVITECL